MNQAKFYPGIYLEFQKIDTEQQNEMITNPLILDNVNIQINMICIDKQFTTTVNRHTSIETIIRTEIENGKLFDKNSQYKEQFNEETLNNLKILYQNKLYSIQCNLDDIGIIQDNKQIEIVYIDDNDKQEVQDITQNTEQLGENLTDEEIKALQYEKYIWQQNMGIGQVLSHEDKLKLKQQRQEIKQLLKFKVYTIQKDIQFKPQIISIPTNSTMEQLDNKLCEIVNSQLNLSNEQLIFYLGSTRTALEFANIPAYDYFNGANTSIRFEVIKQEDNIEEQK